MPVCLKGVGGFDVMTTMYRSRSGTKSELAGVSVSLRLGSMMPRALGVQAPAPEPFQPRRGLAMCAHQIRQALGLRNDDRPRCSDAESIWEW